LIAIAITISSGARNNNAELAATMSNSRLRIDAEGSTNLDRRERRLR
jgi:hypothetical protein